MHHFFIILLVVKTGGIPSDGAACAVNYDIPKLLYCKLPFYFSNLLSYHNGVYRTRLSEKILSVTPSTRTELGKTAFSSYAQKNVWKFKTP